MLQVRENSIFGIRIERSFPETGIGLRVSKVQEEEIVFISFCGRIVRESSFLVSSSSF